MCPYLHGRCALCGCRGHDAHDGCDPNNESVTARLRDDFEEQANVGLYTRTRNKKVAWGFYPVPPTAPRGEEPFFAYQEVLDKSAAAGLDFVRALLEAPENQIDPPQPLEPENAFERAVNPRPLPEVRANLNDEEHCPGPY